MDDQTAIAPRTNPELFGHEDAEKVLADAFHGGALAHAWLLSGPQGIGKATLAFRFARYVLKHSGNGEIEDPIGGTPDAGSLFGDDLAMDAPEDDPEPVDAAHQPGILSVDETDPVFRRVASGGHADLAVVERAIKNEKTGDRFTVIRVDDVRAIGGFLRMTPAEGGWRVVIVDAADDMNLNAQNALLKILEEPPARSLILMVAHVPGRLLPTIRSRCRNLALRALPDDTVAGLIRSRVPDVPDDEARTFAELACGSIGRALRLIEGGGGALFNEINNIFDNLPKLNVPLVHDFAGRLARKSAERSYDVALDLIERRIRERIRAISLNPDGARSLEPWLEVWDNSLRLRDRAESVNLDRKQVILGILHAAAEAADGRI
ncbi:MAG: DNA polymerase III subunit delta' [Rhodospirillales bacterium]